jgi:hypothetical protein
MSRGTSHGLSRRSSSTTSPTPRVRVPRHVARLVVDYFAYAARPGASAPRAARHAARHTARRRLLRLAWLVVDYFAYAACSGASSRCAARLAACRRLLRLRRASGCLGTSRGSSRGSLSTTPCTATSSCGYIGSTSATPCIATTCLAATLALLRVRRALLRCRIPVASRQPFILTSFPN